MCSNTILTYSPIFPIVYGTLIMPSQKRKAFTPLDINITNGDGTKKRYRQDMPRTPCPNRLGSTSESVSRLIEPNYLPSLESSNNPPRKPKGKTRTDPFQLPELPNFSPFRAQYPLHPSRVRIIAKLFSVYSYLRFNIYL